MSTKRTNKTLTARIQLDYLKRYIPLQHWKRVFILVCVSLGILWICFGSTLGDNKIQMPGPVSKVHHLFENSCVKCHTNNWDPVPDKACLSCHTDKTHNKNQVNAPACASCHIEHQKFHLLETLTDQNCANCHGDLKLKDAKKAEVTTKIHSFSEDHPEWDFLKKNTQDETAIRLNHKIHLKPGLDGPDGKKVNMVCSDCHLVDLVKDREGQYRNAPIKRLDQCDACHKLGFDTQFPGEVVPHKKPEEVKAFLSDFYQDQLIKNPDIYKIISERNFAGPKKRETPLTGNDWLNWKTETAKNFVFNKTCTKCHDLQKNDDDTFRVPEVKMPSTYFKKGRFDHAVHRALTCESCHTKARESEKSTDLLIPGIKECIRCHSPKGMGGATCGECHIYHSPGLEKVMEGTLNK